MATQEYFYSRGRKVPVLRRDDLVAMRLDAGAEPDRLETAVSAARTRGGTALEPSDEFTEMQSDTLRLFKAPSQTRSRARSAAADVASTEPGVKLGDVYTNDSGRPLVLTDEIVVKFKREMSASDVEAIRQEYGLDEVEKITFAENAYLLRTNDGDTQRALDVANKLIERGIAEDANPNWIEYVGFRALMPVEETVDTSMERVVPTDPMFNQQWHLRNTGQGGGTPGADIRATAAWDVTMGNPALRVAVIDGGTDIGHFDLNSAGKSVDPINLMVNPPTANPVGGAHGTQVAGMAVASANNGVVGCGSAPNCRLIAIRASDTTPQLNMAKGFVYAADRGADVLTCSLGPNSGGWVMTGILADAIAYATTFGRGGRGTVYFHAVANGPQAVSLDEVCSNERAIAVGRSDNRDRYDGASFGPELDLIAPGVNVVTITNTTSTSTTTSTTTTGTSFASPLTAGVAALVLSVNPNLSWEEVRQVLIDTAEKIDTATQAYAAAPANQPPGTRNNNCGYGRPNAAAAVAAASTASGRRDLYIRDTAGDSGTVPQPAWGFWDSPDIWVRNADDNGTTHQAPVDGQTNFVYARIRNRGTLASHPAWIRFLVAGYAGTEFRYPFDYKKNTTADPGGTPGNLKDASAFPAVGTYLIGTQRINPVPAGGSVIVKQAWPDSLITSSGFHSCLLIDITPHDGPTASGEHVWENNNLGQKNVTVLAAPPGRFIDFRFQWGNEASKETSQELEIRRIKGPQLKTYLDVKSNSLLTGIAKLHNIRPPKLDVIDFVPGPIEVAPGVLNVLPKPGEGAKPNFTLTFLDPAKIAIKAPGGRADDAFVVTFPRGSSVELNRGELAAEGGDVIDDDRALTDSFQFAKVEGVDLIALNEKLAAPIVRLPIDKPARREAALKVEVPKDAAKGDTYVIDVGAKNSRGQLVGGVRLQIEVS